jgi:preprotein translocase subunit SecG
MDQGLIRLICGVLCVALIALIMLRRRNRAGSENQ